MSTANLREPALTAPSVAVADVRVCVATLPSFIAAALLKIDPAFGQRQ